MSHSDQIQIIICASIATTSWISMLVASARKEHLAAHYLGALFHLSLAPVVALLAAAEWVRIAGYIWVFMDAVIDVSSINGLKLEDAWTCRMGVHVPAGIWIFGASLSLANPGLVIGGLLGMLLVTHALIAPYVPRKSLFIVAGPLMTIWLGLLVLR